MPQPFPRSYPVKALLLSACFLSPFIAAEESTSAARDTVARYGVVVEAENPVSISLPFRILADSACSGGTCIIIPRGTGKPPQVVGRLRYLSRVTRKAEYRLWLRTWWRDGDGNSFTVQLGDITPVTVGQDGTYQRWHWVPGPLVTLDSGTHNIFVFNREDGVRLDRLLLAPDRDFIPRGKDGQYVPTGWAESDVYFADDFARSGEAPNELWKTLSGDWKINHTLDPNRLPNFYAYRGRAKETGMALTGYRFWRDYQVKVALKPFSSSAAGLIFSHVDDRHYLLARWVKDGKGDAVELCKIAGGKEEVLSRTRVPRLDAVWSALIVQAWGNEVKVLVDDFPLIHATSIDFSGGKVGLYVRKGEAVFDNFEVSPIRIFRAGLGASKEWWDLSKGEWEAKDNGEFTGKGSIAIALTGKEDWKDYEIRVQVSAASRSFGLLACYQTPQDYYLYEYRSKKHRLYRLQNGKRTELAKYKDKLNTGWTKLTLRRAGGHLQVQADGETLVEAWDDTLQAGRPGLLVDSSRAVKFRGFEVQFLDPGDDSTIVESFTFLNPRVVDPTDVPDISNEQYLETIESERANLLRRNAKYYAIVSKSADTGLWNPACGQWSVAGEQLLAQSEEGEGLLYYSRHVPGDNAIQAEILTSEANTSDLGLILQGDRRNGSHGYRLLLKQKPERTLVLERGGQAVAERTIDSAAESLKLEFRRSGNYLLGWVNGSLALSYKDEDPVTGDAVGLVAAEGSAAFDSVSVSSLNHRGHNRFYAFDRPETDWLPVTGRFQVHGGISCQRASTWVSLLGNEEPAVVWIKRRYEGDIALSLKAMENSLWFGWGQSPNHMHTTYENIGISLCADGKDVASGYAVIVNGWNLQRSAIVRKGKIVASLVQGTDFPCQYQGGHAPLSPRGSNIRVTLKGNTISLLVNGVPVLSYKDRRPLREGMAGVWCWDARMNLADVYVEFDRAAPQSPIVHQESLAAGGKSVEKLIKEMGKALNVSVTSIE